MTTYINALEQLADQFDQRFRQVTNVIQVPTADYGWVNHRYTSSQFRLAHVEKFVQERFAVVHVCVFPHINDPSPIYGFDVIAGENKATGLFFDLSPTVLPPQPFANLAVERARERPEWGDIFSEHWVACRPSREEFDVIATEALRVLDQYLLTLHTQRANIDAVVAAQNHYCQQQKRNTHTRSALVKIIGEERTREFMDTVLFPEVPRQEIDINTV
jgi:phycocyanobilin:ferredoxin oxidoreductase